MFNIDSSFTHLECRREQVLTLLASINGVAVKVPGFPTSPAMACIVAWDAGGGSAVAVIYLYYGAANRSVGYSHEPKKFPMTDLPQVIDEAREFLESMGYMLDDSGFGTLSSEAQLAIIERTPVFHKDLSRFVAVREAVEISESEVVEDVSTEPALSKSQPVVSTGTPTPTEQAQRIGRLLSSF